MITPLQPQINHLHLLMHDMPKEVKAVTLKLAYHDFKELNRWVIAGAWRPDIINALKEVNLYDEQVEGAILSEMESADGSL